MNVILTGAIGAGKSTAVRRAVRYVQPESVAGVITYPIRQDGRKSALALRGWDGKGQVFARARGTGNSPGERFEVDLGVFNTFGVALLHSATDAPLFVIDELGVLEQEAAPFTGAVGSLWQEHPKVLAVVQQRAMDFWAAKLGTERPYRLLHLNEANRDSLPAYICEIMA